MKEQYGDAVNVKFVVTEKEKNELYIKTIYGTDIDKTIDKKIQSLLKRRWTVLLNNNEKKPLYTSDNPFAIGSSISQFGNGYARPGAVIYLPLSSYLLLCSFHRRFEKKDNKQVLKENEVDRVNFAQIFSSKRFVFQRSKDIIFIVKTLKDYPLSDENKPKFEVSIDEKG